MLQDLMTSFRDRIDLLDAACFPRQLSSLEPVGRLRAQITAELEPGFTPLPTGLARRAVLLAELGRPVCLRAGEPAAVVAWLKARDISVTPEPALGGAVTLRLGAPDASSRQQVIHAVTAVGPKGAVLIDASCAVFSAWRTHSSSDVGVSPVSVAGYDVLAGGWLLEDPRGLLAFSGAAPVDELPLEACPYTWATIDGLDLVELDQARLSAFGARLDEACGAAGKRATRRTPGGRWFARTVFPEGHVVLVRFEPEDAFAVVSVLPGDEALYHAAVTAVLATFGADTTRCRPIMRPVGIGPFQKNVGALR